MGGADDNTALPCPMTVWICLPCSLLSGFRYRPADELHSIGGHRVSAYGIGAWNPAFDVTPAELITGIITEVGVVSPSPRSSRDSRDSGYRHNLTVALSKARL